MLANPHERRTCAEIQRTIVLAHSVAYRVVVRLSSFVVNSVIP